MSKIIPQGHRDAIVEAYLKGASLKEAAAPFGYSHEVTYSSLKLAGLKSRDRSAAHRNHRIYDLNERFFDKLDSEKKAYWLGFITADGSIWGNRISITLKSSDSDDDHLKHFLLDIGSTSPIRYYKYHTPAGRERLAVQATVYSERLVGNLLAFGVGPNKSLTVEPYYGIDPALERHYWRGMFDGDGCICQPTGKKAFTMSLVGNKMMLGGFRTFVNTHTRMRAEVHPISNTRSFRLAYNGVGKLQELARLLYDGATVYLGRKMSRVMELLKLPVQCRDWSFLNLNLRKLDEMHSVIGTWARVADNLGMTLPQLRGVRRRLSSTN